MKLKAFVILSLLLAILLNYSVTATEMAKNQDKASEIDINGYGGGYGGHHHHHHHGHHGHYGGGYGYGHGGYGHGGRWGGRGWRRGCGRFGCVGAEEAGAKNMNIEHKS